jgi:hypothetical protein
MIADNKTPKKSTSFLVAYQLERSRHVYQTTILVYRQMGLFVDGEPMRVSPWISAPFRGNQILESRCFEQHAILGY